MQKAKSSRINIIFKKTFPMVLNLFKIFLQKTLPQEVKDFTIGKITTIYNLNTKVFDLTRDNIRFAYSSIRGQYDAGKILEKFAEKYRDFLVLISDDIYVNHLNFVFGVAYPFIGTVISTFRLRINADKNLFYERLEKTIKHEIGHYLGLKHCKNFCVMKFANSLYELDIKAKNYCKKCKAYLESLSVLKLGISNNI